MGARFTSLIERLVSNHRGVTALLVVLMIAVYGFMLPYAWGRLQEARSARASEPALSEGQEPRDHYRGLPPPEFRGEWTGTVKFVDDVSKHCGTNAYACESSGVIIMPNPCTPDRLAEVGWSSRTGSLAMLSAESASYTEQYRTTMCHEIGHAHGWPGNHWIATATEVAQLKLAMVEELYGRDQIDGGMDKRSLFGWTLGWNADSLAGDATLAALLAANDVDVREHVSRGTVVRLTRCKYWTMRQEREGDGAARMKAACP
jgi:hypothetical protein